MRFEAVGGSEVSEVRRDVPKDPLEPMARFEVDARPLWIDPSLGFLLAYSTSNHLQVRRLGTPTEVVTIKTRQPALAYVRNGEVRAQHGRSFWGEMLDRQEPPSLTTWPLDSLQPRRVRLPGTLVRWQPHPGQDLIVGFTSPVPVANPLVALVNWLSPVPLLPPTSFPLSARSILVFDPVAEQVVKQVPIATDALLNYLWLSPDGNRAVVRDGAERLHVCDLASERVVVSGRTMNLRLGFTRDGERLVVVGTRVRLWESSTLREVGRWSLPQPAELHLVLGRYAVLRAHAIELRDGARYSPNFLLELTPDAKLVGFPGLEPVLGFAPSDDLDLHVRGDSLMVTRRAEPRFEISVYPIAQVEAALANYREG